MQLIHKRLRELQSRFAASDDNMTRLVAACLLYDFVLRHLCEGLVLCVAERTLQIASRQAKEESRRTCEAALALQRQKSLVNPHFFNFQFSTFNFVRRCVALALLHIDAIAFGNLVANPSGDVLGGGVAGQHLVEVGMVKLRLDVLLDKLEVNNHAVLVEFASLAIDGDCPVVSVHPGALAWIGQLQMVAGGDYQPFAYVIHLVDLLFDDLRFDDLRFTI